jgi:hypothetical protein
MLLACHHCGQSFEAGAPAPARPLCPRCRGSVTTRPPANQVEEIPEVLPADDEEPLDVLPVAEPARRPQGAAPLKRSVPAWLTQRREFVIRAASKSALATDFCIADPDNSGEFAFAVEQQGAGSSFMQVLGADKAQSASTIFLRDSRTDQTILVIQRSAFRQLIGIGQAQVELFDGADYLLGSFRTKPFPAKGRFWIQDGYNRDCAELVGTWGGQPDYCFYSPDDDTELARVSAEGTTQALFGSMAVFSWCKRGGELFVSLRGTLSDESKLLFLGSALAVETMIAAIRAKSFPH